MANADKSILLISTSKWPAFAMMAPGFIRSMCSRRMTSLQPVTVTKMSPFSAAASIGNKLLALGAAMVAAAPAYLWAGVDKGRVMLVTIALVVAVNAIALWLVFAVAAVKRDYKPLSRQPDRRG